MSFCHGNVLKGFNNKEHCIWKSVGIKTVSLRQIGTPEDRHQHWSAAAARQRKAGSLLRQGSEPNVINYSSCVQLPGDQGSKFSLEEWGINNMYIYVFLFGSKTSEAF